MLFELKILFTFEMLSTFDPFLWLTRGIKSKVGLRVKMKNKRSQSQNTSLSWYE